MPTDPDEARGARQEARRREEEAALAERWPNEEQRKERRAALHQRLDTFLDAFVECEGSGWAAATDDDVKQMTAIWREIADLKFQRDCDGDSVINFDVANRRLRRLISITVPYSPGTRRTEEPVQAVDMLDYVADTLRTAQYLIGCGTDLQRTLDYDLREVRSALTLEERLSDAKSVALTALAESSSWKDGLTAVEDFRKKFPDASEAKREVDNAFLTAYVDTPEIAAARAEIDTLIEKGQIDDAKVMFSEHRRTYGIGLRPTTLRLDAAIQARHRQEVEEIRRLDDAGVPDGVWKNPVYEAADRARNRYLRDVDVNDQMGALVAAIDAAFAASAKEA